MNTNEIKGKIWNLCIEKGTFNKVKGEDFKEIQEMFEKIVKGYENVEPSQEVFNKIIDSITLEIQNKSSPISFEAIQKEYDKLLHTPIPPKMDFTMNPNESINLIDSTNNSSLNSIETNISNSIENNVKSIKLEEIIMTQNKILIQILETQIKIINILKK
jgi:hypothetical protein